MALCERGASVEVTLVWGEVVRGLVYAHTPPALVLQVPTRHQELEFRLLASTSVQAVTPCMLALTPPPQLARFPPCDRAHAEKREREAVAKARQSAAKIGSGVSKEAQTLFNAIEHIYPQTRWDGHDIVVMGDVVVAPPYDAQHTTSRRAQTGAPGSLLRLVQGIVERKGKLATEGTW